jgi:hypothetical protein
VASVPQGCPKEKTPIRTADRQASRVPGCAGSRGWILGTTERRLAVSWHAASKALEGCSFLHAQDDVPRAPSATWNQAACRSWNHASAAYLHWARVILAQNQMVLASAWIGLQVRTPACERISSVASRIAG